MPRASDILAAKGSQVHSIDAEATVLDATMKMNQHKIGALIVMARGKMVGIFSERDVLCRVVGEQRLPHATLVAEVMSGHPICADPDMELDDIGELMRSKKIRHLPVCEGTKILGMISIGDVNAYHATHREQEIHFLNEYIYGRA